MSRKIPKKLDNPIDNILIEIAEFINPYLNNLKFTPNGITTISLICGCMALWYYYSKLYTLAAICYAFSYFFDCVDGNYARRYNMESEFGDAYDHIKDWSIILVLTILFLINNINIKFKIIVVGILVLILTQTYVHIGCTEKYLRNTNFKNSKYLESVSSKCPNIKELHYKKNFGLGTFNIALCFLIYLHNFQ